VTHTKERESAKTIKGEKEKKYGMGFGIAPGRRIR